MELLHRYLNAVRFWLPAGQEDDIIAELRDDLRAEIADRESDLGRPVTESEISAILKRRGDPVQLAGSYLDQKPLVDPGYLPVYWFIVKLVTLWVLIPVFVLIIGPIEAARSGNVGLAWVHTIWNLAMGQVLAFGVITLVFVCLDRSPWVDRTMATGISAWDPSQLAALPAARPGAKAIPRSAAIAEIISNIIAMLIWVIVFWGPSTMDLNSVHISTALVWTYMRWPVLAVCFASIGAGWFGLMRPYSIRILEKIKLAIDVSNLTILAALLFAGSWVGVTSSELSPEVLRSANTWSNTGIRIGIGLAALLTGYSAVQRVLRLWRGASVRPTPIGPNITV